MLRIVKILSIILGLILSLQIYACDEEVVCPKCGEKSEFTWNPSNELVTPRLNRFYRMEELILEAYRSGEIANARSLIDEYLKLAAVYRCNWNYGNAVHNSNRMLGLISLDEGDTKSAANYLVEAGKSSGSPQLDSFGPDLDLANQLLALGEEEAVIEYLEGIRVFWNENETRIDEWIQQIENGETPELHQYGNPSIYEIIAYGISFSWQFLLAFIFWLKLKSHLSNNWLFPILAIISGYLSMYLGGLFFGLVIMDIVDVISADLLVPVIFTLSILVQLGFPFLVIFLVARVFKRAVGNEKHPRWGFP